MDNTKIATQQTCGNKLAEIIKKHSIITKTDKFGVITYANDKFCKISGYTQEELVGQKHSIVRHPSNSKELYKEMWDAITNGADWDGIVCNRGKNGKDFFLHTIIFPVHNEKGEIEEFIALRNDVTILTEQSKLLERIAYHDTLTGLGTYIMLNEDIKKTKKEMQLVFVDINDFSEINNVFGYEIGDEFLKNVAKKLQNAFGESKIYRKNGDIFAILLKESQRTSEEISQIIRGVFDKTFKIDSFSVHLDASIGFAQGKGSQLYKNAELALQTAKKTKQKMVIFNENMSLHINEVFIKTKDILFLIKKALEEDRVIPFFQPIKNNKTGAIEKYECLVRLVLQDGTILPPAEFLSVAKKTKNYDDITRLMIKKSFAYFKDKHNYGFTINIGFADMTNKATRKVILGEIAKINNPSRVTFEILEDEDILELAPNYEFACDLEEEDSPRGFLSLLKKSGCKIAIDDFGTGYSNFARLMQVNADVLKIDGSLIKQIEPNTTAYLIVQQMNIIAHSMGIKTVAEFVSNEAIKNIVKEIGIDYSQGYHIGAPKKEVLEHNHQKAS